MFQFVRNLYNIILQTGTFYYIIKKFDSFFSLKDFLLYNYILKCVIPNF